MQPLKKKKQEEYGMISLPELLIQAYNNFLEKCTGNNYGLLWGVGSKMRGRF